MMLDLVNTDSDHKSKSNGLDVCGVRDNGKSNGEINHNVKSLVRQCQVKDCRSIESQSTFFKFPQPCSTFLEMRQNSDLTNSSEWQIHEISKCNECSRSQRWIDFCSSNENLSLYTLSSDEHFVCSLHFYNPNKGPTDENPDPIDFKTNKGTNDLFLFDDFDDENLDNGISLDEDLVCQLWETKELGTSSPRAILLSLYLFISKYFDVKSRMEHTKLQFGQLKIKSDDNLHRFLEFTSSDSSSPSKKISAVCDSDKCPVIIFEAFISHRPPNACKLDSPLYLQPERDWTGPIWFTAMALGKNKLSGMLSQAIKQSIQSASKIARKAVGGNNNNNNNSTIKLKITNLSTGKPVIVDASENGSDQDQPTNTRQKNSDNKTVPVTFRKILPRSTAPILSKLEMEIKKVNQLDSEDKSHQNSQSLNDSDSEDPNSDDAEEPPIPISPPITHRYNTRRKNIQSAELSNVVTKPQKRNRTSTDSCKVTTKKRIKVDILQHNQSVSSNESDITDGTTPKPNYRILTSLLQSNEGMSRSNQEATSKVENSANLSSISLLDEDDETEELNFEEKPLQIMLPPEKESVELDQKSEDELSNLKIELRKSDICPGRSIKLEIKAILGLACGENNKSPQHITELLWQCGALGDKGPWLLVFSMWWLVQNYVGVGSRMNHVKMRWSHIELVNSEEEGEHLVYKGPSSFISSKTAKLCEKIFPHTAKNAQGVGPNFVHLYKLYRDRRLETSLKGESPFYLQPLQGSAMVRKQKIWYGDSPLGKNRIGALMRNIIEKVVRPYLAKKGTQLPPRYQSNSSSKTVSSPSSLNSKTLVSDSSQSIGKKSGVISGNTVNNNSTNTNSIPNKVSLLKPKLIQPLPTKFEDGTASETSTPTQVTSSLKSGGSMLAPTLQLQFVDSPDNGNSSKPTVVQLVQVSGPGSLLLSSSSSAVVTESKQSLVSSRDIAPTLTPIQAKETTSDSSQILSLQLRQDDSSFPTPSKPVRIPKFLALPEGTVRTFTCDNPVPQPPKGHLKTLGDYINQSINYQSENFREHLNALWSKGALGISNPWSLNFSTWFINTLVFGVESRNEHLKLCWGDFVLSKTSEGREFIYFVNRVTGEAIFLAGNLPGKTQPGEVCPLEIFKSMRDHRPSTMLHPGARFYLQPRSVVQLKGNVPWFTETGWGKNKLGGLMSDAAQMANLPFSWLRKRRARNYFPGSKAATLLQAEISNLPPKKPFATPHKNSLNQSDKCGISDVLELLAAPKVGDKCGSAAVWMITSNYDINYEHDDPYTAKITLKEMEEAFPGDDDDDDDTKSDDESDEDCDDEDDSVMDDQSKTSPKTLELSGEPDEGEELEIDESFDIDNSASQSLDKAPEEAESSINPLKTQKLFETPVNMSKSAKKRKNSTPLKLYDDPEPDW